MRKTLFVLATASLICVPEALAGESVVRKSQDRILPSPTAAVPWLDIERRSMLPRGHYPLGRQAEGIGPLVLQPVPNVQMSFNEDAARRM
jgi:hypothetical protein